MNAKHLELCSSADWAKKVETVLMPWVLAAAPLGDHLIEVGPGPGLTTDLLRHKVQKLTAVEIDGALAEALRQRLAGTNVEVFHVDATKLPFEDGSFSAAASFTMLHHVPSVTQQNRLLAELARVLRPGGVLVGIDSLDSPSFRALHADDVCVPIDPLGFEARLRRAGFTNIKLTVRSHRLRFIARTRRRRAAAARARRNQPTKSTQAVSQHGSR